MLHTSQQLAALREQVEAQQADRPKAEEPVRSREYETMASDVLDAIRDSERERDKADEKEPLPDLDRAGIPSDVYAKLQKLGKIRRVQMQCETISKMSFAGAHFLPRYQGPCANLHGHTWTAQIQLDWTVVEMPKSGILIDFHDLEAIVEPLDHGVSIINHYVPVPTAENIVVWIGRTVIKLVAAINCADYYCHEIEVTVWESPDNSIKGTFYVDPLERTHNDE